MSKMRNKTNYCVSNLPRNNSGEGGTDMHQNVTCIKVVGEKFWSSHIALKDT